MYNCNDQHQHSAIHTTSIDQLMSIDRYPHNNYYLITDLNKQTKNATVSQKLN